MCRLRARDKLEEYNTVDDAVALIARSKKILVLTGAGVSVRHNAALFVELGHSRACVADLVRYPRLSQSDRSLRSTQGGALGAGRPSAGLSASVLDYKPSLIPLLQMFDLPYFKEKPNVFYSFAKVGLRLLPCAAVH